MKHAYRFAALTMMLVMVACATFTPQNFSEKLAAGYTTVTANRQLNTSLMNSGVLSARDGANVQQQNDTARAGLDVASTLAGKEADDKLAATVTILEGLKKYLETRKK